MTTATQGSLSLEGQVGPLAATVATKAFHGQLGGQSLDLKMINRDALKGSVAGATLE